MNTLSITQVTNGFILHVHDTDGNLIDTAVAGEYNVRGYGTNDLCTVIESMCYRNKPSVEATATASVSATAERRVSEFVTDERATAQVQPADYPDVDAADEDDIPV